MQSTAPFAIAKAIADHTVAAVVTLCVPGVRNTRRVVQQLRVQPELALATVAAAVPVGGSDPGVGTIAALHPAGPLRLLPRYVPDAALPSLVRNATARVAAVFAAAAVAKSGYAVGDIPAAHRSPADPTESGLDEPQQQQIAPWLP